MNSNTVFQIDHAYQCTAGPGFERPPHVREYARQIRQFMDQHVLPAEPELEVPSCLRLCRTFDCDSMQNCVENWVLWVGSVRAMPLDYSGSNPLYRMSVIVSKSDLESYS